ncbi:uncharacterized protein LOC113465116 [Ceratina calcarata]|uniref:Uncharacterized protein LOC113465116 n=1 Tax=Ceratina calcarata TaxID=156304 RepID=A0AAJ7SCF1_9HYME|nr:uncharacterized protein LOC113465116 [Ceratina calcarata]
MFKIQSLIKHKNFTDMSYSQEEVERKRLLALQRKKEAQAKKNLSSFGNIGANLSSTSNVSCSSSKVFSSTSSMKINENRPPEVNKSFNQNSSNNFFNQRVVLKEIVT